MTSASTLFVKRNFLPRSLRVYFKTPLLRWEGLGSLVGWVSFLTMIAVHHAVIDRGTKPNIALQLVRSCWVSFPGYATITGVFRNGTKPNLRIYASMDRIFAGSQARAWEPAKYFCPAVPVACRTMNALKGLHKIAQGQQKRHPGMVNPTPFSLTLKGLDKSLI